VARGWFGRENLKMGVDNITPRWGDEVFLEENKLKLGVDHIAHRWGGELAYL
jgi:hypothetical protein